MLYISGYIIITGIDTAVSMPLTNSRRPTKRAIERLRCSKFNGFCIKSFLKYNHEKTSQTWTYFRVNRQAIVTSRQTIDMEQPIYDTIDSNCSSISVGSVLLTVVASTTLTSTAKLVK